jgi:hypothetical protein
MKPKPAPRRTALEEPRAAATDDVDDAGTASFPASDPPGWSTLRIGPPETSDKDPLRTADDR